MKFIVYNTKLKEEFTFSGYDIQDYFWCESFSEGNILKSEYENTLEQIEDEEERQNYINYWESNLNTVYDNEKEYYKEMIEFEKWCSPKGAISLWQVKESE